MRSSYIENNYGEVFRAIIDAFKPKNCVELGVLDGYSTSFICGALQKNGDGTLTAYDLFEDYPFKHGNYKDVSERLADYKNLTLVPADAFKVHERYGAGSVDFLHVDLSNTGETVRKIMQAWDEKMVQGGVILFEGGTEERDQIEWMIKYKAEPIKPEIETNPIIQARYIYGTYLKFPGLTMLLKKR